MTLINLVLMMNQMRNMSIHVFIINIQSLPAKFEKLKYLISEFQEQNIDIDFILLCETFLTDNIAQQFNIPGYNLLSRNRNTKRGGVAIFINNKHNYQSREDLEIFVS